METIENIIKYSPVGTKYDFFDIDMTQRKLSKTLSFYGWKKDYNNAGVWMRLCRWPYLTYHEGLKKGVAYARMMIIQHAEGRKHIMNKDVHVFAGMRMSQGLIEAAMIQAGYKLDGDMWEKQGVFPSCRTDMTAADKNN